MVWVVGFFRNVFEQFNGLYRFITTPVKDLIVLPVNVIPYIGDMNILSLLGIGLVGFLSAVLIFHLIRLFIGG